MIRRIGMVLSDRSYPPDIRVRKEADALLAAGYEVAVLSLAPRDGASGEAVAAGLGLARARIPRPGWGRRIRYALTGVDPAWVREIGAFIQAFRPDVLHVHDLYQLASALRASPVPVVADLHENLPAAFAVYREGQRGARGVLYGALRSPALWRRIERATLPRCARVIVVVPEAAERLRRYGIADDRIVLVSNTEDDSTFGGGMDDAPSPGGADGNEADGGADHRAPGDAEDGADWVASYIGSIGPHRGLGTVIRGLALARGGIPRLRLRVTGAGPADARAIRRMAVEQGVEEEVRVDPWIPSHQVPGAMRASAVGLVPHEDREHTQTTVPHKLFQYMMAARPVLVSDCRPLARIVRGAECGLVFRAGDPADFARQLARLHADPAAAAEMGRRGRSAALGPLAWRHDAARLVGMYTGLSAAEGE